ncbi:MAG: serine hydrolase [Bacilli bacterium]|nr:serine hydrolase [Bacilli bacterium]
MATTKKRNVSKSPSNKKKQSTKVNSTKKRNTNPKKTVKNSNVSKARKSNQQKKSNSESIKNPEIKIEKKIENVSIDNKKKSHPSVYVLLVLLIVIVLLGMQVIILIKESVAFNYNKVVEAEPIMSDNKIYDYNYCINEFSNNLSDNINNKINEINEYIKKYNVYVKYEDLKTGFSYGYREDEPLYGASLIKLVDALYLIDKDIDLNDTIKYTNNYRRAGSVNMNDEKINSLISLKKLMEYSITLSDNTAHIMLIDYIGKNNLKEYGHSLGAINILNSSDEFGSQSASDMIIYLKKAYELSEKENGKLLIDYMKNYYQNNLYLSAVNNVAHKYGAYNEYYHDVGIVYDFNPYVIAVLTKEGNNGNVIKEIHQKIYELHQLYYQEMMDICNNKVYNG